MTPKEIAKELVYKYYNLIYLELNYLESKQCALIAIDEILAIFYDNIQSMWADELSYWHQVKKEICDL